MTYTGTAETHVCSGVLIQRVISRKMAITANTEAIVQDPGVYQIGEV